MGSRLRYEQDFVGLFRLSRQTNLFDLLALDKLNTRCGIEPAQIAFQLTAVDLVGINCWKG